MKNFKRIFAALLAVVMIMTMLPMAAIADDSNDAPWLQMESYTDPQTGKSTFIIKLNVDKIKKGKVSGLDIGELFEAVLGNKEVANSGIISMKDLLQLFPILYEVDEETGKVIDPNSDNYDPTQQQSASVLNVVGATAIR